MSFSKNKSFNLFNKLLFKLPVNIIVLTLLSFNDLICSSFNKEKSSIDITFSKPNSDKII